MFSLYSTNNIITTCCASRSHRHVIRHYHFHYQFHTLSWMRPYYHLVQFVPCLQILITVSTVLHVLDTTDPIWNQRFKFLPRGCELWVLICKTPILLKKTCSLTRLAHRPGRAAAPVTHSPRSLREAPLHLWLACGVPCCARSGSRFGASSGSARGSVGCVL